MGSNASPTASATDKPETPYQPLNGEGVQNQYDGFDLLLMNHFSSSTALELFPSEGARHVWQHIHQWLPRPGQGRFIISSEGWLYFRLPCKILRKPTYMLLSPFRSCWSFSLLLQ